MKKKILILLWPYKFRKFDYERYELKELKEKYNYEIIIHELIEFLYPHFKKAYSEELLFKNTKKFKSLKDWRCELKRILLKNVKSKIVIIKHDMRGYTLNEFLINYELKKNNATLLEISGKGFPIYEGVINIRNILSKIINKIKNPSGFIFYLNKIFFTRITKIFCQRKKIVIAGGMKKINEAKFLQKNRIIKGNSFDYSNYLTNKKNLKSSNKYILFLEGPVPLFPGDALMYNGKFYEGTTKERWIPSLNKFFKDLERTFNLKVKIAAHPKVKHKKNPTYYGGREILTNRLYRTSLKAKFLISVWSTGHSYAIIYKKPSLLISSNEMVNLSFIKNQNNFGKSINSKIINIDDKFNVDKVKLAIKINKRFLEKYKYEYLTTRKDSKPNYKLINQITN